MFCFMFVKAKRHSLAELAVPQNPIPPPTTTSPKIILRMLLGRKLGRCMQGTKHNGGHKYIDMSICNKYLLRDILILQLGRIMKCNLKIKIH